MPTQRDLSPGLAGVDLGSNSFHMVVARVVGGQLHVVDRMRERVQLAAGLDERKQLSPEAEQRALVCLERFGQRLRHLPSTNVRAVGTNTLRQAKNSRAFLERAEAALGHPIEIIAGREEARLVYLGVAYDFAADKRRRRLVVDIGGGSTECIIGEGLEPLETDSLYMGCVTYSMRFFGDGRLRREDFRAAQIAAQAELQSIERRYRFAGWDQAVGASGTIVAVDQIIRANGWDDGVTARGLKRLRKALVGFEHLSRVELPGLPADRVNVIAGGVAILEAVFEAFGLEAMAVANGALREGLLYDLLGRFQTDDVREQTIRRLVASHHVDVEQARRVETTANTLLEQVAFSWELDDETARQYLSWAARLHEIGLSVAHSGYHKHSAYLLEHGDLPGFSRDEQLLLALVVLNHRRRFSRDGLRRLAVGRLRLGLRLSAILRLAVCLNRGRGREAAPAVRIAARGSSVLLSFPRGYLDEHPMTATDLREETERFDGAGLTLEIEG